MTTWNEQDPAAIAFLFVACARTADGELVEAELVRIVERVGQWMPGATREQLHEVLERAVALYQGAPDQRAVFSLVEATAARLRDLLVREDRERLVTELIGLAYADGQVDIGETDFVLATARILGVEVALATE
ncbi:TerB family tellurite resistance protein [Enhygromyxa salina]|uniref:Tellurite resistance protein TerB n=1 Tax=Enhygromyxa salina TaxID=215803 RepID=A0A2S9YNT4_9BACT|nr:TerB family tellurite resistance protein [Enhygromyxa salina]PRQ06753.1 Tellurite resistance protein TerB [Enhygromyxa salina]